MKQHSSSKVPPEILAQAKRRAIVACLLTIPVGSASLLWGASKSTKGIQTVDIILAIASALFLTALCYASWPRVVRSLEKQYADPRCSPPENLGARQQGHDGEA
jgi:hypothetical protein